MDAIPAASPDSPPQRMSWPAMLAALLAVGALYSTAPSLVGLPLLAALIFGSRFTSWRLPDSPLAVWTIRLSLFLWALLSTGFEGRSLFRWYLKPEYTNLLGMLCAIELGIRSWQSLKRNGRGDVLLLTGLTFAMACNTFDPVYVRWLAPALVICLLMSFRDFRPRFDSPGRWSARAVRSVFLAGVLAMGLGIISAFQHFGDLLNRIRIDPVFRNLPRQSQVGMGTPNLGPSANMYPSPVRVLRVEGLTGEAHLRGASFEVYDHGRWGRPIEQRVYAPANTVALNSTARGPRLSITRLVEDRTLIYAPLNSAGINPVAGDIPTWEARSGIIRGFNRASPQYQYEAILWAAPEHQGPLCARLDDDLRRLCLEVPETIDPRVIELAKEITRGHAAPRDKAAALEQYLQANFQYSLEVRPGPGDRVSDFVLNRRAAHCQYFASALAIMLRGVGVPARIVTGYYAHESAGAATVTVRQRDAHAWTEAWIDGVGWMSFDATPGTGRPDRAYESVGSLRRLREWLSDWWGKLADWIGGIGVRDVLLTLAGIAGLAVAAQWVRLALRRSRRRREYQRDSAHPDGELGLVAEAFERLLGNAGVASDPAQTWRETVARCDSPGAARIAEFVDTYDRIRFGLSTDLDALRRLLRDLQQESTTRKSRA